MPINTLVLPFLHSHTLTEHLTVVSFSVSTKIMTLTCIRVSVIKTVGNPPKLLPAVQKPGGIVQKQFVTKERPVKIASPKAQLGDPRDHDAFRESICEGLLLPPSPSVTLDPSDGVLYKDSIYEGMIQPVSPSLPSTTAMLDPRDDAFFGKDIYARDLPSCSFDDTYWNIL